MELERAALLANELMGEWGLLEKGWRFGFDRAKLRFGCCSEFRKMITLSRSITELNDKPEVRNALLHDGIATFSVAKGGGVHIERLITTYQQDSAGTPDTSFLDVNTMLTLGYLRFTFRARFALRFPRHKLANDDATFGAGQAIVTPRIARGEVLTLFREWEDRGLVENIDQFKQDLIVERNSGDPNRLDILLPPDIVNQLRVTAAQIQFRL